MAVEGGGNAGRGGGFNVSKGEVKGLWPPFGKKTWISRSLGCGFRRNREAAETLIPRSVH